MGLDGVSMISTRLLECDTEYIMRGIICTFVANIHIFT